MTVLTAWAMVALTAAADDLHPVQVKPAPSHGPVILVQDGKPRATIAVLVGEPEVSAVLRAAIHDLQTHIRLATGAELPIRYGDPDGPAIVIGNGPLAAAQGLVGSRLPVEGLAIKTAPERVYICGHDAKLAPWAESHGTAWGIYEFLERFVGVRWYYPTLEGDLGTSVPAVRDLVVPPVWIEDAPVFRKREIYPPCGEPWHGKGIALTPHHTRLRAGNSWPISLTVHQPNDWDKVYAKDRPEVFQLRSDGGREFAMLCYGNPRTLETYLENIAARIDRGDPTAHIGIVGDAITVSPNDAAVVCYCKDCRALWNEQGGPLGTASAIVAQFTAKLSAEVKRRWPTKTIVYLPYQNYTMPPAQVTFAGNVEVQMCGMPGLAQYKEPSIAASEQAAMDAWVRLTGRKIQHWHYCCWPEDQTKAAYLFPHTIRDFYQRNREKAVGSFINGVGDHWPRQHLSLYVWLKVLWNPDFPVEAAIGEYCRRMYGPAAATMQELVRLQIDGWEKSRWPAGRLSPQAIYEHSYPRPMVLRMEQLLAQARQQAQGDDRVRKRIAYYAGPLEAFFAESREYAEGTGRTVLVARKVGEAPIVDGRLDDAAWKAAESVSFIRALDRKTRTPQFPTSMQAVWTAAGVTFGFRLTEPRPDLLARDIRGRDDGMAWWNDNVELFLDVTGQRTGYYQFIVTPNGVCYDSHGEDATWNGQGVQAASFVGPDFWSVEVFVPYSAFPDVVRPATGVVWYGNFTRHRLADRKPSEYQRLNTTYEGPSNNMMAFGPIRFVE